MLRHEREVAVHGLAWRVLVAVGVGLERAIGDAAHVELLVADEQELALGAGAFGAGHGPVGSMRRRWDSGRSIHSRVGYQ